MVDIRVVSSKEDIDQCLRLRRLVFIEEQQVPEDEEVDGDDDHCTHILARVDGIAMGAARFQYIDGKAKIQRVCVLKEARGTGLGAQLMRGILETIKTEGKVETAVLGSQTHALAFYEKLGFSAFGDEYLDAGILHQDMKITL
jgi:ElaA protein